METFPLAYVPGLLADLPSLTAAAPVPCARRFPERLGFATQLEQDGLSAVRAGDRLLVALDAQGRIVDVSAGLELSGSGRGAPGKKKSWLSRPFG